MSGETIYERRYLKGDWKPLKTCLNEELGHSLPTPDPPGFPQGEVPQLAVISPQSGLLSLTGTPIPSPPGHAMCSRTNDVIDHWISGDVISSINSATVPGLYPCNNSCCMYLDRGFATDHPREGSCT